jgi:hypothetical protein
MKVGPTWAANTNGFVGVLLIGVIFRFLEDFFIACAYLPKFSLSEYTAGRMDQQAGIRLVDWP